MPIPVFEQEPVPEEKKEERKKEISKPLTVKFSGFAIFFSILTMAALIIMGEFAFRDANDLFNPHYESCHLTKVVQASEACPLGQYEQVRLILHADIAVPLILISVLIYMLVRDKKLSSTKKVVSYGYFGFSLFLLVRIVAETEYYFLSHHELYGKYLVIFTFVILFTILVVQIQKKFSKKRVQ